MSIQKIYLINIKIFHIYLKKKLGSVENLVCDILDKKICCSHMCFKTSIKSWIITKKGAQSNSI